MFDKDQVSDQDDFAEIQGFDDGEQSDVIETNEKPENLPAESEGTEEKPKSNYIDYDKSLDEQKDAVKQRINELYRKSMKAEKLEQELESLRKQQEAVKPIKEVTMPDADLALDNPVEFNRQNAEYNAYLLEKHQRDIQEKAQKEQADSLRQQQEQERLNSFRGRAKEAGINDQALQYAAKAVEDSGLGAHIGGIILDHPNGAEMLNYLGNNFDVIHEMTMMPPAMAVAHLFEVVKPKAVQKKTTSAPPPPTKVSGSRLTTGHAKGRTYR